MKNLYCLVFLLACYIGIGEAIECYSCAAFLDGEITDGWQAEINGSMYTDPDSGLTVQITDACNDPFVDAPKTDCETLEGEFNACLKMVTMKDAHGAQLTWRSCGHTFACAIVDDAALGLHIYDCCMGDNCNHGNGLFAGLVLVSISAIISAMVSTL